MKFSQSVSMIILVSMTSLCFSWKRTSKRKELVMSKSNSTLFTVSIQRQSIHWCTGALVTREWVLTAADPFYRIREIIREFTVRASTENCDSNGIVVPISRIFTHPYYQRWSLDFDIALVKTAKSLDSALIRPVWIKKLSQHAVVSYWPNLIDREKHQKLYFDTKTKFPHLLTIETDVIEPKLCEGQLLDHKIIDGNLFCVSASAINGLAVGAPVTDGDGLVGVVTSWQQNLTAHLAHFEEPFIVANKLFDSSDVTSWIKETFRSNYYKNKKTFF